MIIEYKKENEIAFEDLKDKEYDKIYFEGVDVIVEI